ncbi:MAG TPA: Uma2 family endonuclease [Ktedonobacterales bacterium]
MAEPAEPKRVWQIPERLRLELLAALSTEPQQAERMTFEEFLAWADEDTHAEWVDGRVTMPSPASAQHQRIQKFLASLLSLYVEANDIGEVMVAPFQMRLPRSSREPDLLFVATAHRDQIRGTYLDGPADLVVEILSPESIGRDRGEKFLEYREGGVPEYWLMDPLAQSVELYLLDERGHYVTVAPDADGVFHSRSLPGFWLDPAWLWQEPLPNVIRTMKLIAREAYERYAGE